MRGLRTFSFVCFTVLIFICPPLSAKTILLDKEKIDKITGLQGGFNNDQTIYSIQIPRTDVKVLVDQFPVPPFLGLNSSVAFASQEKDTVMVVGDLILFQDEINPVMDAAFKNDLEVTTIHHELLFDEPRVFVMHLRGFGSLESMATAVREIFRKIDGIRKSHHDPQERSSDEPLPGDIALKPESLEQIFDHPSETQNGMVRFIFGTQVNVKKMDIGPMMGVSSWAVFCGRDDRALVNGDFAVKENELQSVLRTLRRGNILVTGINHHMTEEIPRLLFVHYWGIGKAEDLANTIKEALIAQYSTRERSMYSH